MTPEQTATPDASAAAPAASRGTSRWKNWLGGLVGVLALIRFGYWGVQQVHPFMPQCDASNIRDTINDIYKKRAQLDVKTFEQVQTMSHSDSAASCSAHLTLSNDEKNIIVYGLSRDGRSIQVKIEKATEG